MASKVENAARDFIGRPGHETTVSEAHNPAVTSETIRPHEHTNVTTAVQKEVHQDHHHTTVQPVHHREVLPEQHSHNVIPVEHRTFDNESAETNRVRETLAAEHAKFKDTSTTHDVKQTQHTLPSVSAERVHHHVHEYVQPVIHKEVVQPKVIHTTVPIHETHHIKALHHGTSTLPPKTLDEWTKGGGVLEGKELAGQGGYEGCPRPYDSQMQSKRIDGDEELARHSNDVSRGMKDMKLNGNADRSINNNTTPNTTPNTTTNTTTNTNTNTNAHRNIIPDSTSQSTRKPISPTSNTPMDNTTTGPTTRNGTTQSSAAAATSRNGVDSSNKPAVDAKGNLLNDSEDSTKRKPSLLHKLMPGHHS